MKKITVDTNPITVNIKDVNRIIFHIFFPIKRDNADRIKRIMLRRFFAVGSKKYNTPEKKGQAIDDNLIMKYDIDIQNEVNYTFFEFTLIVPNEGLIDGYSIDGALEFLHEMIFKQNVNKGTFDKKEFEIQREFLIKVESDFPRDINQFAYEEYNKFIDPEEKNTIHEESYLKMLNEVTPEDVYEYYERVILNNNYFTFIGGNIKDNPNILKSFNKYFKQPYKKLQYNVEYLDFVKDDGYQEKVIKKNYNQSMVFIRYTFKDYKKSDIPKLATLKFVLDSFENNNLFYKLRIENHIAYTYNSKFLPLDGEIVIVLYVDKSNIELSKKIVNEVFDIIKDKEKFEEFKKKSLKAMGYDLLSVTDNPFASLNKKVRKIISYSPTIKRAIKETEKVTYEDMMELLSRMSNTKTMIIESGDDHE